MRSSFTILFLAACSTPASPSADAGLTKEQIGQQAFTRRGCPDCHGTNAAGSMTPLVGTAVYPANLTHDLATGIGSWTDDDVVRAIRQGFQPGFVPLCSQMARYDKMSDDEVGAIIAYLRSLPTVSNAVPKSSCPPIKN